jgi:predicted ATP-dependent serine protease
MAMSRQERINSQKKQYRIDSVKQAFKDDISITPKSISQLKDSTTGTVSDVLNDTTANQKDDVASLANKVNEILLALKSVGIVK